MSEINVAWLLCEQTVQAYVKGHNLQISHSKT